MREFLILASRSDYLQSFQNAAFLSGRKLSPIPNMLIKTLILCIGIARLGTEFMTKNESMEKLLSNDLMDSTSFGMDSTRKV